MTVDTSYLMTSIKFCKLEQLVLVYGHFPFLFVIVMIVLVHDAVQELSEEDTSVYNRGDLEVFLYADNTLQRDSKIITD